MKKVFRVSKQGLTRCPECTRHIFLAFNWRETACHFCDAQLVNAKSVPEGKRTNPRSNLIAAGLISASLGLAACDDSEPEPTDATPPAADMIMMDVPDTPSDAVYGAPGLFDAMVMAPDVGPQPDYGNASEPDDD